MKHDDLKQIASLFPPDERVHISAEVRTKRDRKRGPVFELLTQVGGEVYTHLYAAQGHVAAHAIDVAVYTIGKVTFEAQHSRELTAKERAELEAAERAHQ